MLPVRALFFLCLISWIHQSRLLGTIVLNVIKYVYCDLDIRRDALSMPGIQEKSTNDVVSIIESREMARNATPLSSVSAMSSYRRVKQTRPDSNTSKTVPCPECQKPHSQFREKPGGGTNKTPYKLCIDCWRSSKRKHKEPERKQKEPEKVEFKAIEVEPDHEQIFQLSALES